MNFILWILSVLAGGTLAGVLLAAAAWLARNWILTRLKASVQHEFNQKIERVRSDLRKGEDALRDVRTTALSALAAKETTRDMRRIEGIEAIWRATLEIRKHSAGPASAFSVMRFEEICNRIATEPKLQQFFQMTMSNVDGKNLLNPTIERGETARPWVSPLVWSLFKAYLTIGGYANAIADMLKIGMDPRKFVLSPDKIHAFLAAALPEQAEAFRPFRPELIASALEYLEASLLVAIREDLSGTVPNMATLEQAKRIAEAADSVSADIAAASPSVPRPPPAAAPRTD